jgi:transposase
MNAMTVAVDLAKDVFEVAVANRAGRIVERKRVTRRQLAHFIDALPAGTTVVMEACGPYVRRNSTDRTDVEGVLEANRCGGIHPVAVKRVEQQMLHRMRAQWQATRTARLKCDAGRVARMRRAPRRGGAHGAEADSTGARGPDARAARRDERDHRAVTRGRAVFGSARRRDRDAQEE